MHSPITTYQDTSWAAMRAHSRRLSTQALALVLGCGLALAAGCGDDDDDDDSAGGAGGSAGSSGGAGGFGGAGGMAQGGMAGAQAGSGGAPAEGGAGGASEGGVPADIPYAEHDKWLAEGLCKPLWTCCPDKAMMNRLNGANAEGCLVTRKAQFGLGLRANEDLATGSTVDYDGEALASCVKAKLEFGCDEGLQAWLDIESACEPYLIGKLEVGDDCVSSLQCKDSYCDGDTEKCVALKASGAACDSGAECQTGICDAAEGAVADTCLEPMAPAELCEIL